MIPKMKNIQVKKWKKWFIISIFDQFVVKTLLQIKTVFDDAYKHDQHFIALDLEHTRHLDSSALTLILNFSKRCLEKGGTFVIFGPDQYVSEIFSIVGLDKAIRIFSTQEQFENHDESI
jgi:anti-anti-sigma factor